MLDPALLLGLAALLGARAAIAPWTACLVALASFWIAHKKLQRGWILPAIALFGLSAYRCHRELHTFDHERIAVRDALTPPATCHGRGVISGSPRVIGDGPTWVVDLEPSSCDDRPAPRMRARIHGGPIDLARGDEVEVVVNLAPTQLAFEPDLPDPVPRAALSGIVASGGAQDVRVLSRGRAPPNVIDRLRNHVRERILATYPLDAIALGRALVLGEEDLDPADADAFRKSGLAHLLAVSGAHLVLVVAGFVVAMRALLVRIPALSARFDVGRISATLGAVLAFAYADFAGSSGSALRAAAMASVVLTARALGRRSAIHRALGLSLLSLLLCAPLLAFDLSFLLSLAATTGLLTLGPALSERLPKKLPTLARGAVSASLSASLACAPLLATIAPTLPLLGVAANLLAVPIGETMALPLCLAHALLSPIAPLERGVAFVGGGALIAVRAIARFSSSFAWSAIAIPPPIAAQTVILALLAVALLAWPNLRRLPLIALSVAALIVSEAAAFGAGSPKGELRVTFLDVGQGDATLVDFPDGRAMLIDGGGAVGSPIDPGRAVILPTLRARRKSRIDVMVLTHPHPDHFLGLVSVAPEIQVGEFWDNGQGEDEGAGSTYADLLAGFRARNVPIVRPKSLCGSVRSFGEATVDILSPCPAPHPFAPANDGSIVLRISFGTRSVLLVGDAERAEESELLALDRSRLHADVLKAGHHGSRTSTSPAFLRAVAPSLVVISSGVRNRFGHPHPTTLATLRAANVTIARTDHEGAIVWRTDGRDASFTTTRHDDPP